LELESTKEKIRDNQEKIKLNKQLPYLVGNVVEVRTLCTQRKKRLGTARMSTPQMGVRRMAPPQIRISSIVLFTLSLYPQP